MTATLRDVARRAGVSVPTVSLILSGRDMTFKESTRQAVMDAAASLSYRPDSIARRTGKASSRRDAIGLLIRSESASRLANSPSYEFICGINDVLMEKQQFLVMVKLGQLAEESGGQPPRVIAERFVDGLIVESGLPQDLEEAVLRYNIPTIWLNSHHHDSFDCVYPDEVHSGRAATEYLIAQGHTRIAFIAPPKDPQVNPHTHFSFFERERGYRQAMESHELSPLVIAQNDIPWSDFQNSVAMLCASNGPSAVVVHGFAETIKLHYELARLGRSDIAVVTADDMHIFRRSWPELCGIQCDRYTMGRVAADMMLAKLDSGEPQAARVFRGELLGSTAKKDHA